MFKEISKIHKVSCVFLMQCRTQATCLRLITLSRFSETSAVRLGSSNPKSAPTLEDQEKETKIKRKYTKQQDDNFLRFIHN